MPDFGKNPDLARRYQAGDAAAGARIVYLNEPLVYKIARYYQDRTGFLELEDLVQEGRIALLHAARRFEPERGWQFSTYVTHWIRWAIHRAVEEQDLPIGIPFQPWHHARGTQQSADPLDDSWEEMQECDNRLFAAQMLGCLDGPTERFVIEHRYGLDGRQPGTLSEVSETLGISRAGVRQIEARALRKLREIVLCEG